MLTPPEPMIAQHPPVQYGASAREWFASIRKAPLWTALALEDLRDRYRRTVIGLLWVVVSFALFVVVKVTIFGQLARVPAAEFGLYVVLGFGIWTFINSMVTDACTAYMHAKPWILGTTTPYPVYLLQAVYRNWLTFSLILLVMGAGLAWKTTSWDVRMLWALPALLFYLMTAIWLAAGLAPICLRYRDLHHAVQTLMRLAFFATPILWMPATNSRLAVIAKWNPATHFIAILRDPLMYNTVPWESWAAVIAINLLGAPLGFSIYARTRARIVYWI